jgi:putative ABC transport system ATP-binding protein
MSAAPPAAVFRDVRLAFREGAGERVVLDGLSGAIAAGQAVALTGPSGSGKSSLLNLAAGIEAVQAGSVRVLDQELAGLDDRRRTLLRRRRLGVIWQDHNLLPTLTVLEQVLLRLDLLGQHGSAARLRAMEALTAVGLAERAPSFPDRLSGGEQQRVAIAAALVHGPELILADEPTGSLDRVNADSVMALLLDLVRRQGATLLVATHDPAVAERCDATWRLAAGRIAAP